MSFTFQDGPIAECQVGDHVTVTRTGEKGVVARTGRGITGKSILKVLLSDGKDKGKVVELNPKQVQIETKSYTIKEIVRTKPAPVAPELIPEPAEKKPAPKSKMEELFTAEVFDTEEQVIEHKEKKARRDKLARLIKACYAVDDAVVEKTLRNGDHIIVCPMDAWNKFVEAVEKIDKA